MLAVTVLGMSHSRGRTPGSVSRWRPASTLWQSMSLSTPPPCFVPSQNQALWGPLCSSALRARYGGPLNAATAGPDEVARPGERRREDLNLEVAMTSSIASTIRRASATVRPSGFSIAMPTSSALPERTSSQMVSITSTRT